MLVNSDGPITGTLQQEDYSTSGSGELTSANADLNLVVGSAQKAESYIASKQWALLWRDADLLYQSPRPLETFENTFVLTPNVQRFTVAKCVNAIVPQLHKGLFYQDPPMILRPRPGTHQTVVDAKTAMISFLLDECDFRAETKWGLETMATFGTGIWKWGIEWKEIIVEKRVSQTADMTSGPPGQQTTTSLPTTDPPNIISKKKIVPRVFFENKLLSRVLVDHKTPVGDIQRARFVCDVRYVDYYDLKTQWEAIQQLPDEHPDKQGWSLPKTLKELQEWWMPPTDAGSVEQLNSDRAAMVVGVVHHSEDENAIVSPDLLRQKKELIEYWDRTRKIFVIDRRKVILSTENPFNMIPFLSANWWNRPKAFYGMGLGLIIGQNQRVDQGTINAILKILSFGVNPVYLRKRDGNTPTQMIRTGLGKILSVDGEVDKAYRLLETPRVPSEVFSALQESQQATESSSGADQTLVQGSTAGPRSGMGRTSGGANLMAGASATRLDGPLDNFIEQVFKPFMYILEKLVFKYMSDAEIMDILGDEIGNDFKVDLQQFHDAKIEYEVLAGASLAAKRTMAQSMTLITQIFETPAIQQNLADINGEYIDFKPIVKMWMEASEWKNVQDIIKPLTPEMKARQQANSPQAQAQAKAQVAQQGSQQQFVQKQQLEDQATDNRIKRDIVREAFRTNSLDEATEGSANPNGLSGQEPNIT